MAADDDFVAKRGRERRGLRDGDDRTARIARWLAAHPDPAPIVHELVLSCASGGEEAETLSRWERKEVSEDLAPEINALIQDCANDRGTTVGAMLSWVRSDDGTPWLSKGFRAFCDAKDREIVKPMDGTMTSVLSGMQRHNEAYASQMTRMAQLIFERDDKHDQRFERLLAIQERTIDRLLEKLDHADVAIAQGREAEEAALELAKSAADVAEQAQQEAAEAKQNDTLGKVLDLGMKQLTGGMKS